jgi:2-polyprenyl-3-methyl-5-hydroxy-6-metoxy-1,4-benzoquinol methylase
MAEKDEIHRSNEETRQAWNANAAFWDERMGEGNDFLNVLVWPAVLDLLQPRPGQKILDVATGNGLTARRLAALGAQVVAFDFSSELIKLAQARTATELDISYHVLDASDENALISTLGSFGTSGTFDAALCNMALFDMADIGPLLHTLPRLLRPDGRFVFSITHPAFNNSSSVHLGEEMDVEGKITTTFSVKISRYMTPSWSYGVAMRGQPRPQIYFDRPLQYYLDLAFQNGFILDGFRERAFPPGSPQSHPLAWGGNFSEIPPVLVARLRLSS